jgi:hypothetical protein
VDERCVVTMEEIRAEAIKTQYFPGLLTD